VTDEQISALREGPVMPSGGAAERWLQEAEFFDGLAARRADRPEPLDGAVIERYRGAGRLHNKEYYFRVMGDLRGKRVLDIGCGEGEDALLLAALGARVTAIDVSHAQSTSDDCRRRAISDGIARLAAGQASSRRRGGEAWRAPRGDSRRDS
jgi:SAM-dependent methyltransferase